MSERRFAARLEFWPMVALAFALVVRWQPGKLADARAQNLAACGAQQLIPYQPNGNRSLLQVQFGGCEDAILSVLDSTVTVAGRTRSILGLPPAWFERSARFDGPRSAARRVLRYHVVRGGAGLEAITYTAAVEPRLRAVRMSIATFTRGHSVATAAAFSATLVGFSLMTPEGHIVDHGTVSFRPRSWIGLVNGRCLLIIAGRALTGLDATWRQGWPVVDLLIRRRLVHGGGDLYFIYDYGNARAERRIESLIANVERHFAASDRLD